MQTFLPYSDFSKSVRVLDMKRLGKQRVENLQIMKALTGDSKGWVNHPAVKMWRGREAALLEYQFQTVKAWTAKGYKDTCWQKTVDVYSSWSGSQHGQRDDLGAPFMPHWVGNEQFHLSHQSNLIRKDPDFYRPKFGTRVPDDLEYVWPVA
jgi:hypothetical protein